MGFMKPRPPNFEISEWRKRPILDRVRPLVVDWGEGGFGSPWGAYFFYVFKMALYSLGAIWVISATPGLGSGVSDFGSWWSEPIVYQKFIAFSLLFEILGLGATSGPLTFRFLPPFGGFLYWLRPGTLRMPPWPGKVPMTSGNTRTVGDVALYLAVIVSAVYLLASPGSPDGDPTGSAAGILQPAQILPLVVLLPLLGLRDKTLFLAARGEQLWVPLLIFFFPFVDMIIGLKLVMVAIWWGAATSKLNRHFPYVVAVMISNSPLQRSKWVKRKFYKSFPDDMRPSGVAAFFAHCGTVVEYSMPLVLITAPGGSWASIIALTMMVIFHIHIISTLPLAVPLEWNIYVIFGALFLFGHYGDIAVTDMTTPWLIPFALVFMVAGPVLGNMRPDLVSFLVSMRYYAGNWATTTWCFRKGSEQKLDTMVTKSASLQKTQLTKLYGEETAELVMQKSIVFRSMHTHGRALLGMLPRAVSDTQDYDIREGEFLAGAMLGWNFGDGHLHHEQLIEAVQQRCHFEPGEVRVIILESQPIQMQRQYYRIVDAAEGEIERGYVEVKEMCDRQPWLDGPGSAIPVHVESTGPARGPAQPDGDSVPSQRDAAANAAPRPRPQASA